MGKVIRLTERDLTRLVKRVLKEEEVPNWVPINPPIGVQIKQILKDKSARFGNMNITAKMEIVIGYFLKFKIAGDNSDHQLGLFSCFHKNKIFITNEGFSGFGGDGFDHIYNDTAEYVHITDQGQNLLYNKLGCKSFVRKDNQSMGEYSV